ncbi:unnamed protein product [Vicia faba]|uniref:Transposase-associated domain-containing protein n=1 Tax=Vicia faba TaxID=3906 RepID=A0AAV0ZH88_VICFA|nr:unnamed protein product [Vicia faba]
MDQSWMYDRVNSNKYGLKDEFVSGVEDFVNKAMNRPDFLIDGGIRCPCKKCVCIPLKTPSEVRHHLYKNGFLPNYYTWTDHGIDTQNVDFDGHSSSGRNDGGDNHGDEEQLDAMNEMVYDARRQFVNVPNENANMENEIAQIRWHRETTSNPNDLRHPSDGKAWKHFDEVYPNYASDLRNVRFGLCTNGFTPYIQASSSPYSHWLIIVTPYNLPPEMCMTKPYMFLTCLVPGPYNPKVKIDVYL